MLQNILKKKKRKRVLNVFHGYKVIRKYSSIRQADLKRTKLQQKQQI